MTPTSTTAPTTTPSAPASTSTTAPTTTPSAPASTSTTARTTTPSAPASTSTTAPTTAPTTPVPPATAPAVPPEVRRPDRALWAVVLLLCGGCVAYVMREHPALTEPVTGAATVTLAVTGVVQWLRRS